MKEEYYQIGEVSRITGISKDTLHFYTKIGLVTPDYINSENHYHYERAEWVDLAGFCDKNIMGE